MIVHFSPTGYFPSVLYFCCFVSFGNFFNLRHFFRNARAYVRTGSYAPASNDPLSDAPKWSKTFSSTQAFLYRFHLPALMETLDIL